PKVASPPAPSPEPLGAVPARALIKEPDFMGAAPGLPPASAFLAPPPRTWKLGNGMAVVLIEMHTAPLVGMLLSVQAGSNADPAGKAGLADLTASMLDEGAGQRGALELAEAIEQLGAQLDCSADLESSSIGLSVLSSRFEDASQVFADVALRPR